MTDEPIAGLIESEIKRGAMPGAAWWVGSPNRVISAGAAGAAVVEPMPLSLQAGTPFDLASLTKPLATALLAVMLDRDGAFSWDALLESVFPELRASAFGAATFRDAALHRARLPSWKPLYLAGRSRDSYVRAIASLPPAGPAGDTLYSDLGYILLGIGLERAARESLDALFDARIAKPLGLRRCGYAGTTDRFDDAAATERDRAYERGLAGQLAAHREVVFEAPVARGRVHDGNSWGLDGIAGHAGLFGTVEDVAAIAAAILEPARLGLPEGVFDAMLEPESAAPHSRTIGFLRSADADSVKGILPDDAVGHSGFTGTSIWIDPASHRIYALLTNRIHPHVPEVPFAPTRRAFHAAAVGAR